MNLNDDELVLLVSTLSEKHMILYLKNKDNDKMDELIKKIVDF